MSTIKADNVQTLAGASAPMADVVNGSARAWVNFNGTGTVAINASHNVGSITDNGLGDYTINFTTAFANDDYVVAGSGQYAAADNKVICVVAVRGSTTAQNYKNTTNCRIITSFAPGDGVNSHDSNDVSVVFFR